MIKIFKTLIIEEDKLIHILITHVIATLFSSLFKELGSSPIDAAGLAWICTLIVSMGKEAYDEYKYKGASKKDWIADIAGMTSGSLTSLLLMY